MKYLCFNCGHHFSTGYVEGGKTVCERCWTRKTQEVLTKLNAQH